MNNNRIFVWGVYYGTSCICVTRRSGMKQAWLMLANMREFEIYYNGSSLLGEYYSHVQNSNSWYVLVQKVSRVRGGLMISEENLGIKLTSFANREQLGKY